MRISRSLALQFLWEIWIFTSFSVCLYERFGLHRWTANRISSPSEVLDAGMQSYVVQLDFSSVFDRVSSNWSLLVLVAVCCLIVGSSSPTEGSESWFMVLLESGSQSFLACHRVVCWVLFWSSFLPVKCLSYWRTDYMPMLMTPHY